MGKSDERFCHTLCETHAVVRDSLQSKRTQKNKGTQENSALQSIFFFRKLAVVLCLKSSYIQVFEDTCTSALITNEDKLFK